jgi:S1-C subfamily serine protease
MIGANHLQTKSGVYVFEKITGSGISNKDLQVGDIIVEFDDKPVATVDNLHKYLTEKAIGKKISLTVLRGGRKQTIMVVPGELKS